MKSLFSVLLVLITAQAFAASEAPKCVNIGSRSEGWYAAEVKESHLLTFAQCAGNSVGQPKCVNIGSRSEGWEVEGQSHVFWDQCSEKAAVCLNIGTRSEGWYAATPDTTTSQLLGWDQCSSK